MVMDKMMVAGITAKNTFNEVMNPYVDFLNDIGAKIGDDPDAGDIIQKIFKPLQGPIKAVVSAVFLMGVIFFVYKAVLAGIPYFNAENPQERSQAKDKLKNALIGAGFCLAGTVIINILLNAFSQDTGWQLAENG